MTRKERKLSLDPRISDYFEGDSIAYLSLRIPTKVGEWLRLVAASQCRSVNNLVLNHLCEMMIDDKLYHEYLQKLEAA